MTDMLALINGALSLQPAPNSTDLEVRGAFEHDGMVIQVWGESIRRIRIIAKPERFEHESPREIAYDLLTTLLSETTNNDACEVLIRERSAHFHRHPDLPAHVQDSELGDYIVIDATVEDELS